MLRVEDIASETLAEEGARRHLDERRRGSLPNYRVIHGFARCQWRPRPIFSRICWCTGELDTSAIESRSPLRETLAPLVAPAVSRERERSSDSVIWWFEKCRGVFSAHELRSEAVTNVVPAKLPKAATAGPLEALMKLQSVSGEPYRQSDAAWRHTREQNLAVNRPRFLGLLSRGSAGWDRAGRGHDNFPTRRGSRAQARRRYDAGKRPQVASGVATQIHEVVPSRRNRVTRMHIGRTPRQRVQARRRAPNRRHAKHFFDRRHER